MFLNLLKKEQKESFYKIGQKLISIDGKIDKTEKDMLLQLQSEMQIESIENNQDGFNLDNYLKEFDNANSKNILLIELFGLAYADGELHKNEKEFINLVAEKISVSNKIIDKIETWAVKMIKTTYEGYELLMEE